jgi:acyl carrier protein
MRPKDRVADIIAAHAPVGVSPQELGDDMNLQTDLGFDSLSSIELLLALERAFDMKLPEHVLVRQDEWMQSVGSITRIFEADGARESRSPGRS